MLNEFDVNRLEEEMKNQFPEATVEEILKLAEFGKNVLKISDGDLADNLLYLAEQILKSDSDLVHNAQYCVSNLIALARLTQEYEKISE